MVLQRILKQISNENRQERIILQCSVFYFGEKNTHTKPNIWTIQITMKNAWPECKIFNWKVTCMLLMCFSHYDNNVTTLHRTLIGYLRQTEILASFLFIVFWEKRLHNQPFSGFTDLGVKLHINSRPSFNLSERWNLFFQ